jgi:cytochrome c biogenesis protein ResB
MNLFFQYLASILLVSVLLCILQALRQIARYMHEIRLDNHRTGENQTIELNHIAVSLAKMARNQEQRQTIRERASERDIPVWNKISRQWEQPK